MRPIKTLYVVALSALSINLFAQQSFREPILIGKSEIINQSGTEWIQFEFHDMGSDSTRNEQSKNPILFDYINPKLCKQEAGRGSRNPVICEEMVEFCQGTQQRCFIPQIHFKFIDSQIDTTISGKNYFNVIKGLALAYAYIQSFGSVQALSIGLFKSQSFWAKWMVPFVATIAGEQLTYELFRASF